LEPLRGGVERLALDLGAGTGRLSAVLLDLAVEVAVEPDDVMRALVPAGATALAGTADQVPLPDRRGRASAYRVRLPGGCRDMDCRRAPSLQPLRRSLGLAPVAGGSRRPQIRQ
jgi:hypothetical protein